MTAPTSHHGEVFTYRRDGEAPCAPPTPQRHDYHVVSWCVGGRGVLRADAHHALRRGVLVLLPAGTPHQVVPVDGVARVALRGVGFCSGCLRRDGLAPLLRPFDLALGGAGAVAVDEDALARLDARFSDLEAVCAGAQDDELVPLARWGALVSLLVEVARLTARPRVSTTPPDARVAEALRVIEARCLEGVGLREIAAQLRLSPSYLTTRVREVTGQTVQAWIIAHRMAEARRLLQDDDELVEVVAERVGYADATHFGRMFRRHHGVSPGAWRDLHRTGRGAVRSPGARHDGAGDAERGP